MNLKINHYNSMNNYYFEIIRWLKKQWRMLTFEHLIYLLLISFILSYITEYLLKYKLLKWIYIGTITVIIITLYNQGNDREAVETVYKLALI